jgi:hypothetical protein
MSENNMLRDIRRGPSPAELEAMLLRARERFVAGTAPERTRQRCRLPVLAVGLTATAAATATAALVLTSGPAPAPGQLGRAGHARTVVTTAWTVHEDADGTVTIRLRQYANPAGLQHTLQADGVNATVRSIPYTVHTISIPAPGPAHKNPGAQAGHGVAVPACNYATTDNARQAVQHAVVTIVKQANPAYFIIHPGAMPHGSALFLAFMANVPAKTGGTSNWVMKPVVLNNDTVPACLPVKSQWVSKPAPTFAPKAAPSIAPKAP